MHVMTLQPDILHNTPGAHRVSDHTMSCALYFAAESISLTPSFGAVHTGGFVVVTGPSSNLLNSATAASIRFGDDGVELNCNFRMGRATVICPVPLFAPNDTGVKTVTLTISSAHRFLPVCTHMGQYRVGK